MSDDAASASGGDGTQAQPGRVGGTTPDGPALGDAGEIEGSKEIGSRAQLADLDRDIVRHLERQREIQWANKSKRATRGDHRTAMLLQRRGDVMQPPCDECQRDGDEDEDEDEAEGAGVFAECVAAPVIGGAAFANGACASCVWEKKTCSLRGTTLALDGGSIRQFVDVENGQFSLRDAIAAQRVALGEQEKGKGKGKGEKGKDTDKGKGKQKEVVASSSNDTSPEEPDGRNIQTIPSSTFFGAFVQDRRLNRVGVSQRGPRCEFDGDELRFPISRLIWEDPKRLLAARSDLAHFLATVDARLYELGEEGDDDSFFWRREAKRLPALYAAPQAPKRASSVQVPQTQEPTDETPDVVPETQQNDETVIAETPPKTTPQAATPKPQDKAPVVPETQPADDKVIPETPVEETPSAPKPTPQKKSPEVPETQSQGKPSVAAAVQNRPSSKDPKTGSKPGTSRNTAFEISDSQADNESSSSDSGLPNPPARVDRKIRPSRDDDDEDDDMAGAGVGAAGPSTAPARPLATTTATRTVGGGATGSTGSGPSRRRMKFLGTALDALNSISGGATGSKRRSGEGSAEEPPEKRPRGENNPDGSSLGGPAA
ncbi:hypothetical protein ASPCAL10022 [Aspergillus calidoustus]|uniref:Uncharacterized protein n=1 Tax=Aspergillus calidoustus TaxID=454130 RepID=A0A0U5G474_ASPCI|nr:hypothetical protein ASPCAL10022 [Aspergillus calidoustus]